MGQTAKELRDMWRRRYNALLDSIFEEYSSHGITVGPDEAMELMEGLLEKLSSDQGKSKLDETKQSPVAVLRFDFPAYRREAHLYAVTRFYKTYFPRKRGAPPLPTTHLDRILQLRFKGMNYVSIAEKLGQPKGTVRKQVALAERRWLQAVEKIGQIKQRSPHLVAREHPVKAGKRRITGQQLKRHR